MPEKLDVVLVIDDAAVRDALKFLLEVEGMTVGLSDSLAAISTDPMLMRCCCIVIDNASLARQDVDIVEALRTGQIVAPVILLASRLNAELRDRCARAGIHRLLQTPITDRTLLDAIFLALGTSNP